MDLVWVSTLLVVVAIAGIVSGQIYMRLHLRTDVQRRSIEHLVLACTAAAVIAYGLVTVECLSSGECFTPQRDGISRIASADR